MGKQWKHLAPPYDPDDGRDCHYYRVLEPVRAKEASSSACDLPREVWLLETPQADDFWCEGVQGASSKGFPGTGGDAGVRGATMFRNAEVK